jgi:hypothetical protein
MQRSLGKSIVKVEAVVSAMMAMDQKPTHTNFSGEGRKDHL